jgi:predicted transcriptional regulator
MENFKKLEDSQIMIKLLDRLRYSANALSKKLNVTPSAIYHIMNGQNSISNDMAYKIIDLFPEVNYMFLKKGEEPIITNRVHTKQQEEAP